MSKKLAGGGLVWEKAKESEAVKEFWERLRNYGQVAEEEKIDIGYYLAQSWHKEVKDKQDRLRVKVGIDEGLDYDWIENISKGLKIINKATPGLRISAKTFRSESEFYHGKNWVYKYIFIFSQS